MNSEASFFKPPKVVSPPPLIHKGSVKMKKNREKEKGAHRREPSFPYNPGSRQWFHIWPHVLLGFVWELSLLSFPLSLRFFCNHPVVLFLVSLIYLSPSLSPLPYLGRILLFIYINMCLSSCLVPAFSCFLPRSKSRFPNVFMADNCGGGWLYFSKPISSPILF